MNGTGVAAADALPLRGATEQRRIYTKLTHAHGVAAETKCQLPVSMCAKPDASRASHAPVVDGVVLPGVRRNSDTVTVSVAKVRAEPT